MKALLASSSLPGMHVLQFAFGDKADNWYPPHNHRKNGVVYPGTHDNDTTLGWWLSAARMCRTTSGTTSGVSGPRPRVGRQPGGPRLGLRHTAILAAQDTPGPRRHARPHERPSRGARQLELAPLARAARRRRPPAPPQRPVRPPAYSLRPTTWSPRKTTPDAQSSS
ncbi:MAG: 4-alpha-glucanotransferase [Myxococcales bacterium]|nr:4-alpha-glucanotransferase [Myxococcales bacterium]